jgi:selenocysteine lyase/cysteine desulfurase
LETGTQNHEGIAGAAAAVEFLAALGDGSTRRQRLEQAFRALHARERLLFGELWDGLGAIAGVTRYGPGPDQPRTPTLAFTLKGFRAEAVARALAECGVFISHGDFYAPTLVRALGCGGDGLVRAGIACYTTENEIQRLIEGVTRLTRAQPRY